jgi:hypothetical protein
VNKGDETPIGARPWNFVDQSNSRRSKSAQLSGDVVHLEGYVV